MKTVLVLLISFASVLSLPLKDDINDEGPEEGWLVPQLDGTFKYMTKTEAELEKKSELMGRSRKPFNAEFYLYTTKNLNEPQQIFPENPVSLSDSYFNKKHPTRIIIHGWQNSYRSDVNTKLREAFLSTGDFNVISVNWSKKAHNLIYSKSAGYVPEIGKQVAAMIDFLVSDGKMPLKNLIVIGHSLGAHIAGFAGKHITKGQIPTIIGLDPALPLFSYHSCDERLCETDAAYVESIQTNGGLLGFLKPIGKAAFYPNGGKSQPGCGIDISGTCSHSRSFIYYAEAIKDEHFASLKCLDYKKAVKKACDSELPPAARLGDPKNYKFAEGTFFTPVNKKSPYGKRKE